jgi:hypothetical protein
MYRYLPTLCGFYIQDWDLVYKQPAEAIDQFCAQNDAQVQVETLGEVIDFYRRAQAGEQSVKDLVGLGLGLGLGYMPGGPTSLDWFRDAIDYLRARTQN